MFKLKRADEIAWDAMMRDNEDELYDKAEQEFWDAIMYPEWDKDDGMETD